MKKHKPKCLLLNTDYTPLAIIDWQRALILNFKYNHSYSDIEFITFYNEFIETPNNKIALPAVIRLKKYYNIFNRPIKFSRKNLFIRDNYTCQYCGTKKDKKHLTYDHIIPKSKWSHKTQSVTGWLNIITSCMNCNWKKGNKTPNQANMRLLTQPHIPSQSQKYLPVTQHLLTINEIPVEWSEYIRV